MNRERNNNELSVIQLTMDLQKWNTERVSSFPRSHRYGIGLRLENKIYDVLDCLVEAKYSSEKVLPLSRASILIEQYRLLLRTALELKVLPFRSHRYACEMIVKIGSESGAWRKQASRRK